MTEHGMKVGDKVFLDDNQYGSQRPWKLAEVTRVTRTQFCVGDRRFKKGHYFGFAEIGGSQFDSIHVHLLTPETEQRQAFLVAQDNALKGLKAIAHRLERLTGQEAIDVFEGLPQHVKDMGELK